MSPRELIEQLNALDEHTRIEAKTASEIGKSVLETICAFANEPGLGGGWILLGAQVDDEALFRQYKAVGVNDVDRITSALVSQCSTSFNHPLRIEIEPGIVNGKQLISVYVPEAAAAEKPVFFKNRALPAAAFRRIGSSDVHCTEDDLAVFYQDRRGESFDGTTIRDADLSSLDSAAIAEYRQLRAEINPEAEELRWKDADLLHALKCASYDGDTLRPTVAGLLLFGTSQALRRSFPLMRVDYIRVPGREWVQDPERRFETIELRAPLIQLIRRARAAILDDLPKAFSLPAGQIQRKDIPLIPDRVIREAVVNALMHRSYRVQGAVQIIRYANRLEIRNPGHSLIAADRLGEPGSETRNPVLAAVLHETNLAETKGSGIRVMRELMTGTGLTPPTFESDRERNQFVATFLFHHFLGPEDLDWLQNFRDIELSDEEARALIFVRETGAITNAAYRMVNSVHVLNASHRLRRLRDHGLLVQKGKGAETYYLPSEKLLAPLGKVPFPTEIVGRSHPGLSGKTDALSGKLVSQSGMLDSQSGRALDRFARFPDLPDDLKAELIDMKRRVSQPEMETMVSRLCSWRPLATEELARLLSRSPDYVRDRLVTPMLRVGKLLMTIPEQPTSPHQKYRPATPTVTN